MATSKLVRVLDEGTDMVFMITKFDLEDKELLARTGWELTSNLAIITTIGPQVASSMSTFKYPEYDIPERTSIMRFNKTTKGVALVAREKDIPDLVDLR